MHKLLKIDNLCYTVTETMDKANQRKDYRHLIRHLEKMKAYPNGDNAARNLADYWYGNHKNRPAMKDELLKAGYPQK